jgi:glycerol uptake facilitator protein
MHSLLQRLTAEVFGSFAWLFVAGAAACAVQARAGTETDAARLLVVALATGFTVTAMVAALAGISGAHLNPAVTIAFWVTRRMGTLEALAYWFAQFVGAYAAASALKTILPDGIWRPVLLGAPALATDFLRVQGMLLEGTLTFFVVLVFYSLAVRGGTNPGVLGIAMGLTVAAATLLAWSYTGAVFNPARALGTALASGFWGAHGVYWVGPLAGGVLAGWLHDALLAPK